MYIAYIYDKDNNLIAQVDEILDFETTKKINDISTASFGLYHTNLYCKREYLKEYRRIKINMQIGNEEKTMFDGVIRGLVPDLTKTNLKLESFEHYLDRRLLNQDYTISDSVHNILSSILADINTEYNTNITLDCSITDLTSKEYKRGESYLKVLQDMAGNGYEFVVVDKVLKFNQTIGIDRTSGNNFVEYRYDINEPDERSIDDVKMTIDGKELTNGVLGKSGEYYTYLQDVDSIDEFGLLETSFSNSGDNASASQTFLDEHKVSLSEFDVDTISKDFFEADLGDLVSVYIYVGNDVMFFDGSMKVIEKKYISGDLPKIAFKLSVSKVKSKNLIEQVVDIQQRLKKLELK